MYELLDAAGATLCDPLLIILLAVMMMPSGGGSSYVFSGKTDDVGFLLLKARAAARKLPCAHRRAAQGAGTGHGTDHPRFDGVWLPLVLAYAWALLSLVSVLAGGWGI